jgi:hemerythrin-like domain-containing protein
MDALELLKDDHQLIKKLLKQVEDTGRSDAQRRRELYRQIRSELKFHERLEETLLYPELKQHDETRDVTLEGFEEHHAANLILEELCDVPVSDETWGAKAKVLQEMIEHHIEEEEGEMFKGAKRVLGKERLQEIGRQMQAMKQEKKAA